MQAYLIILSGSLIVAAILVGRSLRHISSQSVEIHRLVNSRLTEALDDITALKKALTEERRHPSKGRM